MPDMEGFENSSAGVGNGFADVRQVSVTGVWFCIVTCAVYGAGKLSTPQHIDEVPVCATAGSQLAIQCTEHGKLKSVTNRTPDIAWHHINNQLLILFIPFIPQP